jgi:hypothetical protein
VEKAVVLTYPGAVGPNIPGVRSYLVVQAQLTLWGHLVEDKQGVQLAKARRHEAPISVERSRLARIGIEDDHPVDPSVRPGEALELGPQLCYCLGSCG